MANLLMLYLLGSEALKMQSIFCYKRSKCEEKK